MTRVTCGPCGRFMRVQTNAVTVEELTETGEPYKLWRADEYACPDCGTTAVSGFAMCAYAEHYETSYSDLRATALAAGLLREGRA